MTGKSKSIASVEDAAEIKFVQTGERAKIKQLAREKLEESGWTDEVRQLCKDFVGGQETDTFTHADIVQGVRSKARAKVPDHVKAELLRQIKDILET